MIETAELTNKRTRAVHIRVSPIELRILMRAAQAARLTLAEYIRRAAIQKVYGREDEEYWDGKEWKPTDNK